MLFTLTLTFSQLASPNCYVLDASSLQGALLLNVRYCELWDIGRNIPPATYLKGRWQLYLFIFYPLLSFAMFWAEMLVTAAAFVKVAASTLAWFYNSNSDFFSTHMFKYILWTTLFSVSLFNANSCILQIAHVKCTWTFIKLRVCPLPGGIIQSHARSVGAGANTGAEALWTVFSLYATSC